MGTFLGELTNHEGHAAQKLADGTFSTSWVREGEFVAYVASCECYLYPDSYTSTTWRGGEYPPTDAGEDAALAEWRTVHAQPLLEQLQAEQRDDQVRDAEAFRRLGLVDDRGRIEGRAVVDRCWNPDGPHTPESVLAAGEAVAELTRLLAHATGPATNDVVLTSGPDLRRLLEVLCSATGTLDQVLAQLSHRAGTLARDTTIYDDRRTPVHLTLGQVQGALDHARITLGLLNTTLTDAYGDAYHLGHNTRSVTE